MKKPKTIIFDCDGVLVDSEIIAGRIEAEVKTAMGFPITLEEQLKRFVGHGFSSSVVQEELKRLPENFNEIVDERCRVAYQKELKPIKGVLDTLLSLPHPKCVASSSHSDWLDLKLTLTNLKSSFPNCIFSGDLVEKCKPEPDLFHYALNKMGWRADECLVVEDSLAGVMAGKAAGLTVCGFVGGTHILPGHIDLLVRAGADYIVSDIRNIKRILI